MPTRRDFIRTGIATALGAAILPLVDARADVDPIPPSIDPDLAGNVIGGRKPSLTESERVLLPLERNAYYCREEVEIAVTDLLAGQKAVVSLVPEKPGLTNVDFTVTGDGGTVNSVLAPYTLAPAGYKILIDAKDTGLRITISSGVNVSTMLISRSGGIKEVQEAGGNFVVGTAFGFGRLDPDGMPARRPRGMRSAGCQAFENAIAANLPTLVFSYWTGAVTHKPWGANKSWAAKDMVEMMRMRSVHTGQRLRRYKENIISVGAIDEPGLSYGRTPAGMDQSGFPNWDEKEWYEERGWKFTNDPASGTDEEWLKYMKIRCGIIGQNMRWAREDLKSVWPEAVFSTDIYAPDAIMDGTDPMNQTANDIPNTHVWVDWGTGRLGAMAATYIEKAHDPTSKVAQNRNGQLFGDRVPQPQQRYSYHLMLNATLAAGLRSMWVLNAQGMSSADLQLVAEPALRMGPVFLEMVPGDREVAVLWSRTELAMRQKEIVRKFAQTPDQHWFQEPIPASVPGSAAAGGTLGVSSYMVGAEYRLAVITAHQALCRSGYPAHVIHEDILTHDVLRRYKTLVVAAQTFALPEPAMDALAAFVRDGGHIVVDRSTTVNLPGAIRADAATLGPGPRWMVARWMVPSSLLAKGATAFASAREGSYYRTNQYMDQPALDAAAPLAAAVDSTGGHRVLTGQTTDLAVERHVAGEGALLMVLNAHEELPTIPETATYWIYNYAPYQARYRLPVIPAGAAVYLTEGLDWSRTAEVPDPAAEQSAAFEPAEMKLYLVAPRRPQGLDVSAAADGPSPGAITVRVRLRDLKMPWPLTVRIERTARTRRSSRSGQTTLERTGW